MPETTKTEAACLLRRTRARLTTLVGLSAGDENRPVVTASAGLASYPGEANGAHELIALADAALYAEMRAMRSPTHD